MGSFEFKYQNSDHEFSIRMDEHDNETQIQILNKLLEKFLNVDIRPVNAVDLLNQFKEGYTALETNVKGLHHPKSEYESPVNKEDMEESETTKATKTTESAQDTESTDPDSQFDFSIRSSKNGELKYQLFYICHHCNHRGKHYITKNRMYVTCHDCHKRMRVRYATGKFGVKDEFGNYYAAGEYKRSDEEREEEFAVERFQELKDGVASGQT